MGGVGPLLRDWVLLVIVGKKGCGGFGGLEALILDSESFLRW